MAHGLLSALPGLQRPRYSKNRVKRVSIHRRHLPRSNGRSRRRDAPEPQGAGHPHVPLAEPTVAVVADTPALRAGARDAHPIARLVRRRLAFGVLTLLLVSVVVFLATEVLPGNAAFAVLGRNANPARVRALENALHLNRGLFDQYWVWISGLFEGRLGNSLVNGQPVWSQVEPRLVNSAVLVLITGVIGSLLGVALGAFAAVRKDGWFDHVMSVVLLAATSLPEFVVAIGLIILLATVVWH